MISEKLRGALKISQLSPDQASVEARSRGNERELAETQRLAQLGSWRWNIGNNTIEWSDEHYRICGLERGEGQLTFETAVGCVHPDDADRLKQCVQAALRGEKAYDLELQIVRPDRTVRFTHSRAQVVRDDAGRPLEMYGTLQDITDRKLAELAAAESLNLLRAVSEGINDALFVKDPQGRYLLINRAGAAALGTTPEQVIGKTDDAFLAPEIARELRAGSLAVLGSGRPANFEHKITCATGTRIFQSYKAPYHDPTGKLIGTLGVACDITARKQMEDELRRSHEELTDVLESITDGFYAVDRDWHFTYINRRAETLLGLSRKNDIGRSIWDIRPDSVGTIFHRELQRVPLEGVSTTFEGEYQGRWWEVNAYPKNGGVSVYFRDITDRKRVALELFESEQRYRLVAKATNDLIWDLDIRTDRVYFNEALTTVFQYPRSDQQYVFAWWAGHVHPDDHEHVHRSFADALAAPGDVWSGEYRFRRYDGTYADVFDRAYILRDADGRAIRAIGAMQDLSEQKRIEHIERERDGLRSAVEAMEQVLGVVAHELRTPLAAMRAIAELLVSGEAMQLADRNVFLHNMQEATVRMSDTVDTLLEAARLNSGRARWNWQDVDLEQACQDAIETAHPLLTDDRVELTVAVVPPSPIIRGDADALRRLITNLVSNAMKYTTEGAITVAACVVQEEGRSWAEITVADTGRGIPEEIVSRLGEAFALNSGVVGANHVEGTGLGLAICRGITSAHGGVIRIDSAPGRGTTIHVRLRADLEGPVETKCKIQFFPQTAVKGKAA